MWVRNIKIQTRLMGSFLIFSLIPLLITGIFSSYKSSNAMKTKISTYSVQVVSQISQNTDRELARLQYDSIEIQLYKNVQHALGKYKEMSEWEKYSLANTLQETLVKKFSFLHDVSDVLIYTNNEEKIIAYGDTGSNILKLKDFYLKKLFSEAIDNKGGSVWTAANINEENLSVNLIVNKNDKRNGVLLCRVIKDAYEGNQIGYILIRTNERYISNIYKDIDIGEGASIFVMNTEGLVISSRDSQIEVGEKYKNVELLKQIEKNKKQDIRSFKVSIEGKDYLAAYSMLENANWYVVSLIPFSYLNYESNKIGLYTLFVGITAVFFAVLLSFIISRSIAVPLKKLITAMNEAKNGKLSVSVPDANKDEVAEVTTNFNSMVQELKALVENVKSKEKQKRIAEMKALQAQINPHFLSNTLNSIKWLANIQKAENIEKLITALIQLMHVSMGKGGEFITIADEVAYLKDYIIIQEFRYYDKFKVHFQVEHEVWNLKILKFLLQPIIENSLIHGIEPMEGQGVIVIKIFIDEGNLKITVTDNGVGIAEEHLKCIVNEGGEDSKATFCAIGISNVKDRIKMYYGEQYGLHIESIENLYTTVEVILPVMDKRGEGDEKC